MPGREVQLINNQYYHIFNRGVNSAKIFSCDRDYLQFLERISFYQYDDLKMRYSYFADMTSSNKNDFLNRLSKNNKKLIEIIAYCLMPNHFHFIIRQNVQNGISKYISNLTNSYTRYFNLKHKRFGPIFQGKFKAVEVLYDEQLLHLSRYIHLNPYSAGIVSDLDQLDQFPFSSFGDFIDNNEGKSTEIILSQFENKLAYKKFVLDQGDYQQNLEIIKKLVIDS